MTRHLHGKTVLLTGATGSIGQAIARELAAEGARVLLHYNSNAAGADALATDLGQGAIALVAFTQNLARDYAPDNIRVNGVAPGEVRTPMLESNLARSGRSLDDLNALVPFGRIGEPDEIAALVAFLASDEAQYLCGSVVEITGAQAVA
ncbi:MULTISPECIES: SDR family oxidoreductase [unclassified Ruegeria]|uniref:SDR family oxidoreductase n=1 Tax=unclassified Ruegeria TaxID=2625375 RepID=UPI0014882342|nr:MULTISPECIES: SDR family oxidoreductase [unclassified Ruegeria]NOD64886.1 SDR family oxidoreductase [Ruegeria sp. HKCCD6109]